MEILADFSDPDVDSTGRRKELEKRKSISNKKEASRREASQKHAGASATPNDEPSSSHEVITSEFSQEAETQPTLNRFFYGDATSFSLNFASYVETLNILSKNSKHTTRCQN